MGRYVVQERLGAGGMGEVFRAMLVGAEGFARGVALKKVSAALSQDEQFAAMFIAEARIAALLQHPNIVQVIDFDRDEDGGLFLAMELVDGADLRRIIEAAGRAGRRMPAPVAAFVAAEVLRALEYAHTLQHEGRPLRIVHRDVSPHNVLVSYGGVVRLSDFGIAKVTTSAAASSSGVVRGKIAYMAPEQASGGSLDGRCDLHAVGVMLYEMLAGGRPYDGASEAETLAQLLMGRCAPLAERAPDAPADLVQVATRLFAPRAGDRFATAAEAMQALRRCACFPADGDAALARFVRELVPPGAVTPGPAARPAAVAAVTPARAAAAATGTRVVDLSPRALWILGLVAALSVAAVVIVWTLPRRRAATTAPAARPVAAVVDAGARVVAAAPDAGIPPADGGLAAAVGPKPRHGGRPEPDHPPPVVPVAPPGPPDAGPAPKPPVVEPERPKPAEPGAIVIRVQPWADAYVDGEYWGQTPVRRAAPAGTRKVTVKNEEMGRHESFSVEVKPGEVTVVERSWL